MKHLFVPYNLALRLKELGFDEPCFGYYNELGKFIPEWEKTNSSCNKPDMHGKYCTAPLHQQVIQWLYEKHDMFICIEPWDGDGKWKIMRNFHSEVIKEGVAMFIYAEGEFGAYNVAIEEAIKLIEK